MIRESVGAMATLVVAMQVCLRACPRFAWSMAPRLAALPPALVVVVGEKG